MSMHSYVRDARRIPAGRWGRWVALLLLVVSVPAVAIAEEGDVDASRWNDRLPRLDRALLDEIIGAPAPEMPSDLDWRVRSRRSWDDLRGTVVVLQTWTSTSASGRKAAEHAEALAESIDDRDDVAVILLHTPKNAERLERYLERKPLREMVVVDPVGAFCDELGAFRRPVNYVIDRSGIVRYAGLTDDGLEAAVAAVRAEPWSAEARRAPEEPKTEPIPWPTFSGGVGSALDLRGKAGPRFHVAQWITAAPEIEGRVVVLDFWATWCGPCVASIPHMNQLTRRFDGRAAFVGISAESYDDFVDGARKANLSERSFSYALALDPNRQMSGAFQVRGIPHCAVISSDGVVRWQGSPARLTESVLESIVAADESRTGGPKAPKVDGRYRWTKSSR